MPTECREINMAPQQRVSGKRLKLAQGGTPESRHCQATVEPWKQVAMRARGWGGVK